MSSIQVKNLRKVYETDSNTVLAIDDLSITVEKNEFVTILGPSGCGKTTLLKILAGLLPWTAGTIEIEGKPVVGPGPERAMVFQSFALLPWATIRDNVAFGLKMRGVDKAERYARAERMIRVVGLQDFADSLPRQLSGGMQQRVGLARALVTEPEVLLMDEPFSALDEQTRRFMQDELLRTWEALKTTVVFITHSIEEAVKMGDRVVLLSPRPGRLFREYPVAIPRPRVDAESHPEFGRLVTELWHEIRSMDTFGGSGEMDHADANA